MPHCIYHQCLVNIYHCILTVHISLSLCCILIVNISLPSHCECHHNSIVYISLSFHHHCSFTSSIIYSSCSLVKPSLFIVKLVLVWVNFVHSKLLWSSHVELLVYLFGVENLQPYPSRLMRRGLIFLLLISTIFCGLLYLSSATWGGAASHLSSPMGFFLSFLMVGELQLDQTSFDPLPSLPRHPLVEVMSREFPWMLSEWCSASIFCDQHSVFHTAPHLKVLYKICKQTLQINLYIPDVYWSSVC